MLIIVLLLSLSVFLAIISFFAFNTRIPKLSYELLKAEKLACEKKITDLNAKQDMLYNKISDLEKDNARLITEKDLTIERMKQHKSELDDMAKSFKTQFENISHSILTTQTDSFNKQSKGTLEVLLMPLQEELKNFKQTLQDEGKSKASLEGSIKQIVLSNQKINEQAENLVTALKGDNKLQGNWGEIILEKILESSGLRKEIDYIVQGTDMALRSPNDTTKFAKPDVIINLPDDKHIIIDSKISLIDYEKYFSETHHDEKSKHLQKFIKSVRNHINDLSEKRYHDIQKVNTPEFVLMFMGIESAYTLAIQQDLTILNYSWDKKIVLVSPSTLFATLRTIASVWRMELQNQNAMEIARRGGDLYDKISAFVYDMQELDKKLKGASDAYHNAMNKLSSGKGNILKRTQDLKELGIKISKKLPAELVESDE